MADTTFVFSETDLALLMGDVRYETGGKRYELSLTLVPAERRAALLRYFAQYAFGVVMQREAAGTGPDTAKAHQNRLDRIAAWHKGEIETGGGATRIDPLLRHVRTVMVAAKLAKAADVAKTLPDMQTAANIAGAKWQAILARAKAFLELEAAPLDLPDAPTE